MPYERIEVDGTRLAIVRTNNFTSVCEPNKPVTVPTSGEWKCFLPRFFSSFQSIDPNYSVKALKHSNTNDISHVHFAQIPASSLVCRHSHVEGMAKRVDVVVRGTREKRLFQIAQKVLQLGIPTATPVALIERRRPQQDGWLLMEHIEKMQDLDQVCLSSLQKLRSVALRSAKKTIIDGTIAMFEAFRRGGFFHRDMKASNVVVFGKLEEPSSLRVGLVDLEGIRSWGGRSLNRWRHALIRLAASLGGYESVTRADFVRFHNAYRKATGQSEVNWKSDFLELSNAAQRYSATAKGRKGNKLDGYQ